MSNQCDLSLQFLITSNLPRHDPFPDHTQIHGENNAFRIPRRFFRSDRPFEDERGLVSRNLFPRGQECVGLFVFLGIMGMGVDGLRHVFGCHGCFRRDVAAFHGDNDTR